MTTPINGEAPGCAGACQCSQICLTCQCEYSELPKKIQLPRMGSGLRAYLKRYRDDLQPLADAGDRVAAGMIDYCTALLIEADRIEGVKP